MATDSIAASSPHKFKGLSTDTKPTQNVPAMSLFIETDTGSVYEFSDTAWYPKSISGAALVVDYPVKSFTIVSGAYLYEGFAIWGSATSSAVWAMFRSPTAGGVTQRANSGAYSQIADNYASLTYAD